MVGSSGNINPNRQNTSLPLSDANGDAVVPNLTGAPPRMQEALNRLSPFGNMPSPRSTPTSGRASSTRFSALTVSSEPESYVPGTPPPAAPRLDPLPLSEFRNTLLGEDANLVRPQPGRDDGHR